MSFFTLKFLYELGDLKVHRDNAVLTDNQEGIESWFFGQEHYGSKNHHLESRRHEQYPTAQGPVKGNNARHHRRSLISSNVIRFPNGCIVFGGATGFGDPALESMFQSCGQPSGLVQILMRALWISRSASRCPAVEK